MKVQSKSHADVVAPDDVSSDILKNSSPNIRFGEAVLENESSTLRNNQVLRTIYVGNLHSEISDYQLRTFFQGVGDILYIKKVDSAVDRAYCFIEFSERSAAQRAFAMNGTNLGGRPINIGKVNNPIVGFGAQNILANPMKLSRAKQNARLALIELEKKKRQLSTSREENIARKQDNARSTLIEPGKEKRRTSSDL